MDTVYSKIKETFNANPQVFTDLGLQALRTIDIYAGQPEDPENFEVFLPALFIDWSIIPDEPGEADILNLDFHVVQEPGSGTENWSGRFDEGLAYFTLLKAVKYVLNFLRADITTPLVWNGERPRITPFFKYHVLSYTCKIDRYEDSLHRPTYEDATGEELSITAASVKQKDEDLAGSAVIDVFN